MRQINLLPNELKPNKRADLAIKKTEKLFITVLIIYVVLAGTALGAKYYLDGKLKKLQAEKQNLSAELKSLTSIETSTVYIRDRVEKFKTLENKDIERLNLDNFNKSYSLFPADANIQNIQISENSITYSVNVQSTPSFSSILKKLAESGLYKNIMLSAVTYSQDKGYSFNFSMTF